MTNMSFLNRLLISAACLGALAVVGCATTDHAHTHVHATPPLTQKSVPVKANIGYTNTPMIPGTQWHVHDGTLCVYFPTDSSLGKIQDVARRNHLE